MKTLQSSFTILATLLVLFTLSPGSNAQDLDEILDEYFAVIGQENLKNFNSYKQTGTAVIPAQGLEFPVSIYAERPDKIRINASVGGTEAVFLAYDGENGWAFQPWQGPNPTDLPPDQLKSAKQQADMDGPLWNYEEKGHTLTLEGTEEVEGTEAYKIKVDLNNGDTQYYFIDSEAYVPIKVTSTTMMQGQEVTEESFLSNYKVVEGYAIPHSIESKIGGQTAMQITIDSVETNVDIEEGYFSKPDSDN